MTAAVGPVKAKFKGKLQLENLQPPNSYTLRFEGQGGAAGHGKGTAQVRLEAVGANETLLHYEVQASVGGKMILLSKVFPTLAASTVKQRRQHIDGVICPKLGNRPARDVTTADVVSLIESVGRDRKSVV